MTTATLVAPSHGVNTMTASRQHVMIDLPAWAKLVMWATGLLLPVLVSAIVGGAAWASSINEKVGELTAAQRETNALLRGEVGALRGSLEDYKRSNDRRLDRHEREIETLRRPFGPQP
jgi:hypothetical protein